MQRLMILTVLAVATALAQPAVQAVERGYWPAGSGPPHATGGNTLRRLDNDGFVIGYDRRRQRALWVAYRVRPIHAFRSLPRPPFRNDPRLSAHAGTERYAGPAYDRGHLAPNFAISQLYGKKAQRQTFYDSNIVPQRPRLNQLVWQRLEEIEIDEIAPRVDRLWVIVGPIGDSGDRPTAFFRIWLARDRENQWQAMAFRVPQTVRGDERLDRFLVSIDRIEQSTRLDFFSGFDIRLQNRLEGRAAAAATFGCDAVACQPARYGERWAGRDGIHLRYDRCD